MHLRFVAAVGAALGVVTAAHADIFTDDLTRCVVSSASDRDKATLARWTFAELTLNPALSDIAAIAPEKRTQLQRETVAILERITFTQCRPQSIAAFKSAGAGALQVAFEALGNLAGRELMANPVVLKDYSEGLARYMNKDGWEALGKEAGIYVPAVPTSPLSSSKP